MLVTNSKNTERIGVSISFLLHARMCSVIQLRSGAIEWFTIACTAMRASVNISSVAYLPVCVWVGGGKRATSCTSAGT